MELKGDKALINVEVLGWSNPNATNEWDKKWLIVHLYMKIIGFIADYKIDFLLDDFLLFKKSIDAVLDDVAKIVEFKTMEESIYLKGSVTHLGSIEWSGFINYPQGSANRLNFKFESEFYQLERLKRDLNDISTLWIR